MQKSSDGPSAVQLEPGLEVKLPCNFSDSRAAGTGAGYEAEIAAENVARRIVKLGVVEKIEELHAEFKPLRLRQAHVLF